MKTTNSALSGSTGGVGGIWTEGGVLAMRRMDWPLAYAITSRSRAGPAEGRGAGSPARGAGLRAQTGNDTQREFPAMPPIHGRI